MSTDDTTPQPQILDKVVCLAVTISKPGTRRKVKSSAVTTDADPDWIHLSKDIFESAEYDAIRRLDDRTRAFLKTRTLPFPLKQGFYLLPVALIGDVETRLEMFEQERQRLIEAFLAAYPELVEQARTRLASLYDPQNYPPPEQVRTAFRRDVRYLNFGVPGQLRSISAALFKREEEKARQKVAEATELVRQVLRQEMSEMVNRLVDRLSGRDDGKPKQFKSSLVTKFQDFLTVFEARNLADDTELQRLVGQAKALVGGVEPAALRTDDMLREQTQKGFAVIKAQLDTMMVERPKRRIVFDEADEPSE